MNIVNAILPNGCSQLIQRPLTLSDLDNLLVFRQSIFAGLSNPDWVLPESDEVRWAISRLTNSGTCIGLFDLQDKLVAYASIYCPIEFTSDCPIPADCVHNDLWSRITVIDSCMISPPYRGNGLQKALIYARFKTAEMMERPLCLSLTSPINDPSRHNLMSCGLYIYWIGETAPQRIRQILMKDLAAEAPFYDAIKWVPTRDFKTQSQLISFGYRGFCERSNEVTEIGYALPSVKNLDIASVICR